MADWQRKAISKHSAAQTLASLLFMRWTLMAEDTRDSIRATLLMEESAGLTSSSMVSFATN
jgi:hypothetical protein